jgi:alpha-L-fucosidase 2
MGGLISDYIGSQRPDRFGAVGIFSPAYWAGTNHANRSITNQSVRRYLYMGTAESSGGQSSSNVYWQDCLNAYNRYLGVNEAVNRDLVFEGGAGGAHNEGNWSRRLPSFYAFALDPRLEANPLAAELFPPDLSVQSVDTATGQVNLRLMAFYGYQNRLKASADLQTWSTNELSSAENFWDPVDVPVIGITGNRAFWRADSTPGGTSTNTSNYNNLLSVTYDSQGGSVVPSGTTSPGGSIAVAPASPTRSGYTLAGWVTNPIGGSTITFPYQHNQSSSFTLYARWASPSGPASVTRNITYATNGGTALQLDAYRPSGAGPFPAIILVHGGGFVSGSRGSGYIADLAAAVQAAGYAAFDISYRLLGANSTGMSAAQEDLKSAINYVVANAGTLEVDTNRLGTGGGSAGAITALLASYGSNRTTFRPRAVVDLWGAMYGDEGSIRAGDPPMIIIHGTTDTTVPYSYATAINDRATSVGVPVTFFSFNGGHTPALSTVIGGISIQQRVLNFLDQNLR